MTATIWVDTDSEETIELGNIFRMYHAFAEMARVGGESYYDEYPELSGVPEATEHTDDVDPAWLADVQEQAREFLDAHREELEPDAVAILEQLIEGVEGPVLSEQTLREDGFTGIDSHGHHWQNGKQIKAPHEQGKGRDPAEAKRQAKKDRKAWNKADAGGKAVLVGEKLKTAMAGAAAKVTKPVWDKLPSPVQSGLAGIFHVGKFILHAMEAPLKAMRTGIQKGAIGLAKARGLDEHQVAKVARVLAAADVLSSWTGNIPGAHMAIHALELLGGLPAVAASKVGFYVPVASLAYVMHSTAMLTACGAIRGARKVLGLIKGKVSEGEEENAGLVDALQEHEGDDWYEALLYAALDETEGDVDKAVQMANAGIEESPERPEDVAEGVVRDTVEAGLMELMEAKFTGSVPVMVKGKQETWYYRDGKRIPAPKGAEKTTARRTPALDAGKRQKAIQHHNQVLALAKKALTQYRDAKARAENAKGTPEAERENKRLAKAVENVATAKDMLLKAKANLPPSEADEKAARKAAIRAAREKLKAAKAEPRKPEPKETGREPERRPEGHGTRGGGIPQKDAGDSGPMAGAPGQSGTSGADQGGDAGDKPAHSRPVDRVPASQQEVNKRLDRMANFFRSKGQHQVADWMGKIRDHVSKFGTDEALKALGAEVTGTGEKVQYAGAADASDYDHPSLGEFVEKYLDRNGISLIRAGEMDPDKRVISTVSPHTGKKKDSVNFVPRGNDKDVVPIDQTLKNKLHEAQHLPGLEKSEDLGKIMDGEVGDKVSHFTPDVIDKLDKKYGKGGWIVKSYGAEAFAGYGIYFPQRVEQLKKDAQNTIWSSGEELAKHGFEHIRKEADGGFAKAMNGLDGLKLDATKDENAERWEQPEEVRREYNQKVLKAASKKGLLVPADKFDRITSGSNVGGQEHDVYEDSRNGRYYKLTKGGHFGQNKDLPEYLDRHMIANELWPELGYEFHGVTQDRHTGDPRAVVSMNRIDGNKPDQEAIHQWFQERGWVPYGERSESPDGEDLGQWEWEDPKTGTIIKDANAGNFKETPDHKLVPIDIDILPGKDAVRGKAEEGPSKVVGIRHQNGDDYYFGTHKYDSTIHGNVRDWGDKAARAANDEHNTSIPEGSFMAQPAFPVVGISEAERAKGVTWNNKEGRVHIVTRNGKAEIVPHSTWLKGEPLPVVFESDDTNAMAKAAVDAINALPESERKGQLYAPDIVPTTDGYKVVEANPADETGASGYLQDNQFIMDSYVSHLTGREPAHVRFIRKLLSKKAKR